MITFDFKAKPNENKSQIFAEYLKKLKIEDETLAEFGKLETGESRIEFVNRLIAKDKLPPIEKILTDKNEEKAIEYKEEGNKAFGKGDYNKALKYYTKSVMTTPQVVGTRSLSLALANRSAALYHLQEYESAIKDIDAALELDYPEELKYKVLERKAKCMLALTRNDDAEMEFKKTIRALDSCKLPSDRKLKMQNDIQIMLKMMAKTVGKLNPEKIKKDGRDLVERLISPRHKIYSAASDKIEIKREDTAGRFAAAAADISAGDTILIEKPYCFALLNEFATTNCQNCFKKMLNPYACKNCSSVVFCCLKCRDLAKFHERECSIFKSLNNLGVSVSVLMALRIITQHDLQYFLNLKSKLTESEKLPDKYESLDYLRVYNLVHHENLRTVTDIFERSVLALHLLRCLKQINYFNEESSQETEGSELSDSEKFIGSLLIRHLQVLQFNAHEISELEMTGKSLANSKSIFIGGGLYATLALFNHSCDPGIVRYFDGTKVIVRAVKPIQAGEMIAENYGPIYSETEKKKRREYLKNHYMFECTCEPCQNDWPTYRELGSEQDAMRFKCRAGKTKKDGESNLKPCKSVLSVEATNMKINLKCSKCQQYTNILECLKAIKDNTELAKKGSKFYEAGNHREALNVFLKVLATLHEYMAQPFRDYLLTEQYIRACMLARGNKYIKRVDNNC